MGFYGKFACVGFQDSNLNEWDGATAILVFDEADGIGAAGSGEDLRRKTVLKVRHDNRASSKRVTAGV